MLTHTYDASHEHIHNDEPTWCFDHGYYIIINLLPTVINIILNSLAFQPLLNFHVVGTYTIILFYIFSNFAYLSCGVESKLVGTTSVRINQYEIILFSLTVSLVLYGLLR